MREPTNNVVSFPYERARMPARPNASWLAKVLRCDPEEVAEVLLALRDAAESEEPGPGAA